MMSKCEREYNETINTLDRTWKVFTNEEIQSLKKDYEHEKDLFFLSLDYNATIIVIKYIIENL